MNILRFLTPKSAVAYILDDDTLRQGLEKMRARHYSDVPVLDKEGKYVGTLSENDVLWTMMKEDKFDLRSLEGISVRSAMKSEQSPVSNLAPMRELLDRVKEHKFVPVVDDREVFIGIVTRKDVINFYIDRYLVDESE